MVSGRGRDALADVAFGASRSRLKVTVHPVGFGDGNMTSSGRMWCGRGCRGMIGTHGGGPQVGSGCLLICPIYERLQGSYTALVGVGWGWGQHG